MTRLSSDRPWLIKIHCINHRIELAVKDAIKATDFTKVDALYIGITSLLKNSGKIKGEIKAAAAETLNIQHFTLPNTMGTRFVGHRRTAYGHLLAMWPAIVTAFENVVADVRTIQETRSKVIGYLKKLKSYAFLCLTCCYLDVLELITPCSKIFEGEGLMAYEISSILAENDGQH